MTVNCIGGMVTPTPERPLFRNGFPVCQRCGGQIMKFPSGLECLQCGAKYNKDGELVAAKVAPGRHYKGGR